MGFEISKSLELYMNRMDYFLSYNKMIKQNGWGHR